MIRKNRIKSSPMIVKNCSCNVAHWWLYIRINLILLLVEPKSRIDINFRRSPREVSATYWCWHRCVQQSFLAGFCVLALVDILDVVDRRLVLDLINMLVVLVIWIVKSNVWDFLIIILILRDWMFVMKYFVFVRKILITYRSHWIFCTLIN